MIGALAAVVFAAAAQGTEASRLDELHRLSHETRTTAPADAIRHGEEAVALAERTGDDAALARALNDVGAGHYFLSDYGRALGFWERSLAVAERVGEPSRIADALNNLGILHYVWGDWERALEAYGRALEIRRRTGDRKGIAAGYNNLGNVAYAAHRYEESLTWYADALPLYEAQGEASMLANTLDNMGLSLQALGRLDEARRRLLEALAIQERIGDEPGIALTLNNLGDVDVAAGRHDDAERGYRRALEIRERLGDRQGAAIVLQNLGRLHSRRGRHEPALRDLERALAIARELGVREIERDVHLALSETHERMGRSDLALADHKRYKAVADALLDGTTARRLADWKARYDVEKKDREIELLRRDRRFQALVRNVTIGSGVLAFVVGALLWNRSRLKSRARLERTRAELTHVSRVAVLGEMASTLAHEVNQPLTAILSNAQAVRRLVASGRLDPAELDEALADIADGAERAREIVSRLRTMMRRGEAKRERLSVDEAFRSIEKILRADARQHGVNLELELGSAPAAVLGDTVQLQQVLLNLVRNGAEATAGSDGERRLTVTTRREGGRVVVAVRDQGRGADDAVLSAMFDPFVTTKPEGLGMGLPISSAIVEAHGGTLTATRNDDAGLTFRFDLPAAVTPAAASSAPSRRT
ncbi:MAG TPA: tetratricopeptide repeat protein [Candidatus Polarisedimenticolaceae bacterium]